MFSQQCRLLASTFSYSYFNNSFKFPFSHFKPISNSIFHSFISTHFTFPLTITTTRSNSSFIQGSLDHLRSTVQMGSEDAIRLLPAVNDAHGGVIVEMKEPIDSNLFAGALRASLSQWKHEGKKGVWIKLPIGLANLVEIVVKEGFWYHHAEPNYLMLVYWIPDTVCTIPGNATHRIGVGAIVLTDKREMLVVQEKSGRFRGSGIWKIPTGLVDEGEDIYAAAIREVKEETGVDAEFVDILAFRQTHKAFFEKSDLFFLCFLRPLSFEIQKQDLEIEAAQWMPFADFTAQPIAQTSNLFKSVIDLTQVKLDKNYSGFRPESLSSLSSGDKRGHLYKNEHSGLARI